MQMFQPYATTYGTLLPITGLFSWVRLQNHKNINTECPSLLRTEAVSLLPSAPPARLTAHQPNTGSASSLSPVCFPVIQVQVKLCKKYLSPRPGCKLRHIRPPGQVPETQELLLALFPCGGGGVCSTTTSLKTAMLLANEITSRHLLSWLNSQIFDHSVWCLWWKINSNKLSAAQPLLIWSPPCPRLGPFLVEEAGCKYQLTSFPGIL